jgi:hypothetical protein
MAVAVWPAAAASRQVANTMCTTRSRFVFGYVPGRNETYLQANQLDNLLLLCRACTAGWRRHGQLQTGLDGLAYLLSQLAPCI